MTELTGPTILTIIRMIIAVVFLPLALTDATLPRIIALLLFIIGSITDFIDGQWARSRDKVTDLGAFLDPLADKTLTSFAFLVLVTLNVVPVPVFAIILVRDYAVDGIRMMAARTGTTIAASFYGKLKTTAQLFALTILLFNLIAGWEWLGVVGNIALYLSLALTVFSGADYIYKGGKKLLVTAKKTSKPASGPKSEPAPKAALNTKSQPAPAQKTKSSKQSQK